MADDKKNPKEASNIFHSIMKASVKPTKVKCPVCGADSKKVKGSDYICPQGHEFKD